MQEFTKVFDEVLMVCHECIELVSGQEYHNTSVVDESERTEGLARERAALRRGGVGSLKEIPAVGLRRQVLIKACLRGAKEIVLPPLIPAPVDEIPPLVMPVLERQERIIRNPVEPQQPVLQEPHVQPQEVQQAEQQEELDVNVQVNDINALLELVGIQGTLVSFVSIISIVMLMILMIVGIGAAVPYHTGRVLIEW